MGFGKDPLHLSDSHLFSWRLKLLGTCLPLYVFYKSP